MGALGDIRYTLTQSHYKRTTPCVSVRVRCRRCCCHRRRARGGACIMPGVRSPVGILRVVRLLFGLADSQAFCAGVFLLPGCQAAPSIYL